MMLQGITLGRIYRRRNKQPPAIVILSVVVEVLGFVPVDLHHFIDALDCSWDFDVEAFDDEGIEFGTFKKVHGRRVYPFEVNGWHFEFTQSDITKLKKEHRIVLCAKY